MTTIDSKAAIARALVDNLVDRATIMVGPYKGVPRDFCRRQLQERYADLLRDRVRNLGPSPEMIYPWNLKDYLLFPELGKAKP